MKNKASIHLVVLIIVITLIAVLVTFLTMIKEPYVDGDLVECIAKNCILYISRTCGHCEEQLNYFGSSRDNIEVVDCMENPEVCAGVVYSVPTWSCNNIIKQGVFSINEIKEFARC